MSDKAMSEQLKHEYLVVFEGDRAAGLHPFTEIVSISVDSGDPGGQDNEFRDYMRDCISEWYDCASVANYDRRADSGEQ